MSKWNRLEIQNAGQCLYGILIHNKGGISPKLGI